MSRHLIVLEGTDGSGKSTQAELAISAMKERDIPVKRLAFPQYEKESSALVRMYLRGDLGDHPEDVNPYAASTFYAADRYASYRMDWKEDWEAGRVIFSDRYTTSNGIHQSSKLPEEQFLPFVRWLFDFEYRLLELPEPTCVIFLDMPPELSFQMLEKRQGETGDIHERDRVYLTRCYRRALELCRVFGWHRVACAQGDRVRSPEEIHQDVDRLIREELAR